MDCQCTVYKTLDYLSRKWAILIIHELSKGEEWKRFSELKASMKNVTAKILSERLKELIEEGLVEKRVDSTTMPVKSEYRLTPMSLELLDVIQDLKRWALKWKIDNIECGNTNCRLCTL